MSRYAAILNGIVVGVLDADTPPSLHVPVGLIYLRIESLPEVGIGWAYNGVMFTEASVSQKAQFIAAMQTQMTELGQVIDKSKALVSAFVDRGYDAAASDPITAADLTDYGVIVYDMGIAINLLQQMQTLVAQPAFESAVSKWRTL